MRLYRGYSIKEFIYDSREERDKHVKKMSAEGWQDTGQIKLNTNYSLLNPKMEWYARLYK